MSANIIYSVSFDETNKEFSVKTSADKGPWYKVMEDHFDEYRFKTVNEDDYNLAKFKKLAEKVRDRVIKPITVRRTRTDIEAIPVVFQL